MVRPSVTRPEPPRHLPNEFIFASTSDSLASTFFASFSIVLKACLAWICSSSASTISSFASPFASCLFALAMSFSSSDTLTSSPSFFAFLSSASRSCALCLAIASALVRFADFFSAFSIFASSSAVDSATPSM